MGGIMNNSLAARLTGFDSMPFVQLVNRMNPAKPLTRITTNTLQSYLSPQGQEQIGTLIAKAPPPRRKFYRRTITSFCTR